ncbi:hypothetical protein ZWY2020_030326 [Hordeum vulgare]|nr:hypothetical protein ZWY2020_030326 [Hordeum vulgare]
MWLNSGGADALRVCGVERASSVSTATISVGDGIRRTHPARRSCWRLAGGGAEAGRGARSGKRWRMAPREEEVVDAMAGAAAREDGTDVIPSRLPYDRWSVMIVRL